MKQLLAIALLSSAVLSCVSDPEPDAGLGRHRGAVLSAAPDVVWSAVKRTLSGLDPAASLDESARVALAVIPRGAVSVQVEPMDAAATRTILRISASTDGVDAPEVADRIQLSIQEAVLREH